MVALGVVYAGLMAALPATAFFSGDEGIKWLQIDALWRHQWTSLAIDPPGGAFDPNAEFIPSFLVNQGGEVRSVFPVLMPLIASVPYALAGSVGIYLVPAIASILCLAAAARLARFVLPPGWAMTAGVASVAATPLVFYGATLWEHALAAALCTAAMIFLSKSQSDKETGRPVMLGLAAGILLGLAALARTECFALVPAVAAAGALAWGPVVFWPQAAGIFTGAGLLLLPQALYHRIALGSWMPPHLAANMPGGALGRAGQKPWVVAADLIGPAGWGATFAGIVLATGILWLLDRARRSRRQARQHRTLIAIITAAALLTAALLLIGPVRTLGLEFSGLPLSTHDRGYQSLLHTMPIVALLPLALLLPLAPATPRRPHAQFFGWTAALFVALTLALAPVEGGLQWGPRLLLPVAPLITMTLISAIVERRSAKGGRLAMAGLGLALALGFVMQGLGMRFLVAVRTYNAGVVEQVRRTVPAGDAILSDFFAVPQLLATLSPATPVLYVKPGSDIEGLSARLEAADATPFWIMRKPPTAGGQVVPLGAGLSLVRYQRESGVRGYARSPLGD